jgi:hypothetical protein
VSLPNPTACRRTTDRPRSSISPQLPLRQRSGIANASISRFITHNLRLPPEDLSEIVRAPEEGRRGVLSRPNLNPVFLQRNFPHKRTEVSGISMPGMNPHSYQSLDLQGGLARPVLGAGRALGAPTGPCAGAIEVAAQATVGVARPVAATEKRGATTYILVLTEPPLIRESPDFRGDLKRGPRLEVSN